MLALSLFCRPHQLPGGDVTLFAQAAKLADDAGFYSIHFGEHVLMGNRPDRYPFGEFAHEPETPWLDPIVALAAAAAMTSRIRLSTGILLAPLRPGPVLAKQLATLDVISHGRVEPGLGVGWQTEEFESCGVAWDDRYRRFDEVLRTCRRLWGVQPTSVPGLGADLPEVRALPRPIQARIPLLMGLAPTSRNARRIAEYGDGWCPVRLTPGQLRAGLAIIREAFTEAGRDPASLIVRAQVPLVLSSDGRIDVPATMSAGPAYEEAGATVLAVGPTLGCEDMGQVESLITDIVQESHRLGTTRSAV